MRTSLALTERPQAHPFGVNLIGHVSGSLGLGVAARNTLRMLESRGVPVAVVDVDAGGGRSGHETRHSHLEHTAETSAPYAINLFHLNPPDIPHAITRPDRKIEPFGRYNVCVPFWELPRLPRRWRTVLEAMDLVLAPSHFIVDQVESSAPGALVQHYRQAVFLPEGVQADRARFGLATDGIVFLSSFDLTGDIERKNPWAAVKAFELAFPDGRGATLVIKLSNPEADARLAESGDRLRKHVASRPNVILLEERLSYSDVLSLHASADVFVSLHRAEGLGLNILEAMSLGRPVISTAYSGSMDFTNPTNSCLVDWRSTPVKSNHPAYKRSYAGRGQTWAEPDVDQAAEWMRRLANDAGLRLRIGNQAASDMELARREFLAGEWVDTLRDWYSSQQSQSTERANRQRRIRWLTNASPVFRLRRQIGGALRRAGLRK